VNKNFYIVLTQYIIKLEKFNSMSKFVKKLNELNIFFEEIENLKNEFLIKFILLFNLSQEISKRSLQYVFFNVQDLEIERLNFEKKKNNNT